MEHENTCTMNIRTYTQLQNVDTWKHLKNWILCKYILDWTKLGKKTKRWTLAEISLRVENVAAPALFWAADAILEVLNCLEKLFTSSPFASLLSSYCLHLSKYALYMVCDWVDKHRIWTRTDLIKKKAIRSKALKLQNVRAGNCERTHMHTPHQVQIVANIPHWHLHARPCLFTHRGPFQHKSCLRFHARWHTSLPGRGCYKKRRDYSDWGVNALYRWCMPAPFTRDLGSGANEIPRCIFVWWRIIAPYREASSVNKQ